MEIKYYVAMSAVLSLIAAILFYFWGEHAYTGLGILSVGFLVVYLGLLNFSQQIDQFVSIVSIGLLFAAGGIGILPTSDFLLETLKHFASIACAVAAGFMVMANPFDHREYGIRARTCLMVATALPLVSLAWATRLDPAPLPNMGVLWLMGFGGAYLLGWFLAPNASNTNHRNGPASSLVAGQPVST